MTASMPPDLDLLRTAAHRLSDGKSALEPLIDLASDASFVLLGEASHGTHEFYSTRAAITERLIKEKGFQAVAVEGDGLMHTASIGMYVAGTTSVIFLPRRPSWLFRLFPVLA